MRAEQDDARDTSGCECACCKHVYSHPESDLCAAAQEEGIIHELVTATDKYRDL